MSDAPRCQCGAMPVRWHRENVDIWTCGCGRSQHIGPQTNFTTRTIRAAEIEPGQVVLIDGHWRAVIAGADDATSGRVRFEVGGPGEAAAVVEADPDQQITVCPHGFLGLRSPC